MKPKVISLPLGLDEHTAFRDAAEKAGLPLVRWIRNACHAYADDVRPAMESELLGDLVKAWNLPSKGEGVPPEDQACSAPRVIAAPARKVPFPAARRKFPRGESVIQESVPDDASLNPLPDDAPLVLPGPDVVSVGNDGEQNFVAFSNPQVSLPPDPDVSTDSFCPACGERLHADGDCPAIVAAEMAREASMSPGPPEPQPASVPERKKSSFKRSPKCTSPKCENLQTPTCDVCRHANAKGVVIADTPPQPPKAWRTGKRAPGCITRKCEHLGAPACDPCRRFNREIDF